MTCNIDVGQVSNCFLHVSLVSRCLPWVRLLPLAGSHSSTQGLALPQQQQSRTAKSRFFSRALMRRKVAGVQDVQGHPALPWRALGDTSSMGTVEARCSVRQFPDTIHAKQVPKPT